MKRKAIIAIPVALVLALGVCFAACSAKSMEPMAMNLGRDIELSGGAADMTWAGRTQYARAVTTQEAYDAVEEEISYDRAEPAKFGSPNEGAVGIEPISISTRKLIKDIYANVETKDYETYLGDIEAKAIALGGHVSSKDTSDGGYYATWRTRSASLVLRVPANKLEEFQEALEKNGRVTNMNESVRDVTLEYTDVETHIKVLKTERDALIKILEQARNTEELLLVRQQLTQVRYELDALEGKMRVLEDQIALSTVTLNIQEVERLTPEQSRGFWAGAWDMFRESLLNIGQGLRDFSQGFLGAIPYLLLIALPIILLIVLLRRRRKRRRAAK